MKRVALDAQPNSIVIDSSPVTSSISSAAQEVLKAAAQGNDRKKSSAELLSSEASNSSSTNERPLTEIVSENFPPFDSEKYIIAPFKAELARDETVEEEYTTMLLDVVLQTHAWASARFKRKTQFECQKLEDQNSGILKTEKEQGMCSPTPSSSTPAFSFSSSVSRLRYGAMGLVEKIREGLADFVTMMKKALAALTGAEA